ncbi:response regulator transcription factor [bacterium]|nr:response regulator transcription factor [bacterium]
MKILIAEDDRISRRLLATSLGNKGFEVEAVENGQDALASLMAKDAPQLVILDWMMPEIDGIDVIRQFRNQQVERFTYIILLTAKGHKEDIASGLEAGADDYLIKPFDPRELNARLHVGIRMIELQNKLKDHVEKLQDALDNVQKLEGMLPICSYCKKIRNDKNYWTQVESYISAHTMAQFSHSICPDCYTAHVLPELEKLEKSS